MTESGSGKVVSGRAAPGGPGASMLLPVLLVILAVVSSGLVFLGSRSSSPLVLGRYSAALTAALLIHGILFAALVAGLVSRPARFLAAVRSLAGRLGSTGALAELWILGLPPVLLCFYWLGPRITPLAGEPLIRLAGWLAYAGPALAVWIAGGPRRLTLTFFRGVLTVSSVILAFLGAEIALRILAPGSVFSPLLDMRPNVHLRLENRDLPGVSPSGLYSTNKWGMRGEQPPVDWDDWFTIVCIGGSTTQCFELDDSRTWPWLLQENLRVARPRTWVGNGGLGGHGTRGHLVFMREVIPEVRPDMAIFLVGVNELSSFTGFEPGERAALGTSRITLGYRIFCASRVIQVLYAFEKEWIEGVPAQGTSWASRYVPRPLDSPEPPLPEDLHQLMADPGRTRENVRQLIDLAREYGVTPVFVTQPMLFEDSPYWRGIDGGLSWHRRTGSDFSAATVWRLVETANSDVSETCRQEGVACYDLGSALPHSPEMFYDEAHFSEAGAAAVADSITAFLVRSGLV